MSHSKNAVRLEEKRFGFLTVLRRAPSLRRASGGAFAMWFCRCDCGQEIVARGDKLRIGNRKACAINGHRWVSNQPPTFISTHFNEYKTWEKMHTRCKDKRHDHFKHYGGRGIKVCDRWKSFAAFFEDMGAKPTPQHTIERINNDGNYEPGNCRWATRQEQARNTSRSVFVEYQGERMLLIDLTAKLGLSRAVVYGRLKNGWALEEALFIPVNKYGKGKKKYKKKYWGAEPKEPIWPPGSLEES